jgi:hypothetical protein
MNKNQTINGITAPQVIAPASPFNPVMTLVGYIQQTPGSAGNLTFNDCATVEGASIENQILSVPYTNTGVATIGFGNTVDIPVETGLVISSVPTGMVLSVEFSIYVPGHG